ncbi:MAG TPA: hypothetical protein VHZ95_15835 [Polyangiales bacterium]|jgi:hypothetical protein|nr:hypothetical protein [Polyangiales bacterium]
MKHHKLRFKNALVWRYPEAPIELAKTLGQIAADLWVAGKLTLTDVPAVATLGSTDAEKPCRQVAHDQAEGFGS